MPSKGAALDDPEHPLLELLQERDHRLVILGAQLAKPQNDLARVPLFRAVAVRCFSAVFHDSLF